MYMIHIDRCFFIYYNQYINTISNAFVLLDDVLLLFYHVDLLHLRTHNVYVLSKVAAAIHNERIVTI